MIVFKFLRIPKQAINIYLFLSYFSTLARIFRKYSLIAVRLKHPYLFMGIVRAAFDFPAGDIFYHVRKYSSFFTWLTVSGITVTF